MPRQYNRIREVNQLRDKPLSNIKIGELMKRGKICIGRIMLNQSQPNISDLYKLAAIFECEATDLLHSVWNEEPTTEEAEIMELMKASEA